MGLTGLAGLVYDGSMESPSPLAINLRTLTRVLLLSLAILGLTGSAVAVAVWQRASLVADFTVPQQEVAAGALLQVKGIASGLPLLGMAADESTRSSNYDELRSHLAALEALGSRAQGLGMPQDDAVVARLKTGIDHLDRVVRQGLARAAAKQVAVDQALAKTNDMVTATNTLTTTLVKVRSNSRTQVIASQRRSVVVNDRIKALLGTRRILAQVDLWVDRAQQATTMEGLQDVVPRLSANADILDALAKSLTDELHDDTLVVVGLLRKAAEPEGFLDLHLRRRQAPTDETLSKRALETTAAFSTAIASLGNRTGVMIEDLDGEVEVAKTAAKTALTSLQQSADAYDGAAALTASSLSLANHVLALASAKESTVITEKSKEIRRLLEDMAATLGKVGPILSSLGLTREQRALDDLASVLAPLTSSLTGPQGLAAQAEADIAARREILTLQRELDGILTTTLTSVQASATVAKDQARGTMEALKSLSIWALILLASVSVVALLVAWRRSRTIGRAILAAEQDQRLRAGVLAHLVQQIESQITPLTQAADGLTGTSKSLHHRAQGDETQSQGVAATALTLAQATDEVTRSAREIQASITSISDDAQNTQRSAEEAAVAAREATGLIEELSKASNAIAQSTAGVTAIANQTRLLALNAAIEAASAGDAGRGFAVVANEVKGLALQTATENQQIAQRVTAVQAAMARAQTAIQRIDHAVNQASEGQSRIAAAVEQQTATTTEMVDRLAQIAGGLAETAQLMDTIAGNAGSTSRESLDLTALAEQLQGMASQLDTLVRSQSASAAHAAV